MLTDVDLPAPGLLWARWATIASALTGLGYDDVWFVDESGAHHDNHGGGWARFAVLDGARAVLFGYDRDHSETATADPPVDVLTGAPAWLPWDELIERRVRRLSQDEHNRLVWAAMHDAGELPRPAPPGTAELDALADWMRRRSPAGDGRCTVLAYADASSVSLQSGERPPGGASPRELTDLIRRLRQAESDPRYGRWLFLRAETSRAGIRVARHYDSWPWWWPDDGESGPWRTNLRQEMDARTPQWRPSWVRLLDPEVAYRPG